MQYIVDADCFIKLKILFSLSLFHLASNCNNVIVQIHNVEMKLQVK